MVEGDQGFGSTVKELTEEVECVHEVVVIQCARYLG